MIPGSGPGAGVASNSVNNKENNGSISSLVAFGRLVKNHLIKNPPISKPIGYGTNTEVRFIRVDDRVVAEKISHRRDYIMLKEHNVSKTLANNSAMEGWFIPIDKRFKKYEQKEFYGEIKNTCIGWAVQMKPCLTGSLADVVTENTCNKLRESGVGNPDYEYNEYELPSVSIEPSAARFYLANAALIISKMHDSQVAWLDVKAENLLVDDQGYLVACDFGSSRHFDKSNGSLEKIKDWKDLGRRVGDFALQALHSDSHLKEAVELLKSGKISSLEELKKLDAFSDFNWSDLEAKNLKAPYVEIRRNLIAKHIV